MTQPWNKLTERERDKLVAEKVMGKVVEPLAGMTPVIPKYSTDISAAMEVVQTLNRNTPFQHYKIESDNIPDENNRWFWSVSIGSPERGYLKEYGDTLPEAICLAALRAKGIEV